MNLANEYISLFVGWSCEVDSSRLSLLDEPQAPKNYKDPEKIAEYVNRERFEQQKRLSVTPGGLKFSAIAALASDGKAVFHAQGPQAGLTFLRFLADRASGMDSGCISVALQRPPKIYSHQTNVLVPSLLYSLWQTELSDPLRAVWGEAELLLDPDHQRKLFLDPCEMLVQHVRDSSGGVRFSTTALCEILIPEFKPTDQRPEIIAAQAVQALCVKMGLCG